MVTPGAFDAFDLSDRAAVVTGAARGIGRAVALQLGRSGARVVVADVEPLDETLALLHQAGAHACAVPTDVGRRDAVVGLVERAVTEFGALDVMANVAGILHASPVVDTDERDLDRILAVNLKGVYFGCQAAAGVMARRGRGSIVNMASSAAFQPLAGLSAYAVSKAGVVALTRVLAAELAPRGVRVNAIAPGYVTSHMSAQSMLGEGAAPEGENLEQMVAAARSRCPLGIEGRPEDVAHALLYLASDASRYVTGQVLHPNGGSFMP
jgi:3-oxoacyl-[acyl-carrier protein] reductase